MRYIKSALISDELYSTDKFMAHKGTYDWLIIEKSGIIWNEWEFGKMKCCGFECGLA